MAPTLTEDQAATRLRIPHHVVHRAFPAETVLLNLATGQYHGLNLTAGRVLDLLGAGRTPREAAVALAAEFRQPLEEVEADVGRLCSDLLERGLIEPDVGRRR